MKSTMQISNNGIELIKSLEGLKLTAYSDSAGVWTIGYGSTHYQDGGIVKSVDKLKDQAQADILLINTLNQYEDAINNLVKASLTQNQFDAIVSFTYNVGTYAFEESTLLRKLNANDYKGASDAFLSWDKITDPTTGDKIVLDALLKRRRQERNLFLTS